MSSTNTARIGLSLVRYFKPIKMTPPHRILFETTDPGPEPTIVSAADADKTFQEKQKALKQDFVGFDTSLEKVAVATSAIVPAESFIPEKAPAHWVELVLNLLMACRKLTMRIKQRGGVQAYQAAVNEAGKKKMRVIGTIVDGNSDDQPQIIKKAS